jgi:hypothetical protein
LDLLRAQLSARDLSRLSSKKPSIEFVQFLQEFLSGPSDQPIAPPERQSSPLSDSFQQSLGQHIEHAIAFLLFNSSHLTTEKQNLFIDSQSLLYLCVVHFLLPEIDRQKLKAKRDELITALWIHGLMWDANLAHKLYLRSVLIHYLNQTTEETRALIASFRLTDPDDHDYVTKAQAAWMSMLDDNEVIRAKDFMLDVYRSCPQSALAEVREILDETYELLGTNGSSS